MAMLNNQMVYITIVFMGVISWFINQLNWGAGFDVEDSI
jgi:hypothetical protein